MASKARSKSRVTLRAPEAAAAPPATRATAAGTGMPNASARTMKNTNRYPWCPMSESNGCIRGQGCASASIKKKGGLCRPPGAPVKNRYLFRHIHVAHLVGLEHLYTHDVDLALVGIHMRAHFHVMAFMSLERFGIGHVPRLFVFIG